MRFRKISLIIILILVIGYLTYAFYKRNQFHRDFKFTTGKVTSCSFLPRSGGYNRMNFEFRVDSIPFKGSIQFKSFSLKTCNEQFVNKSFPVVYNPQDNDLNTILIFPEEFDKFHSSFPDSQKWVLQFRGDSFR
jgi:hypothetical protein